MGRVWNKLWPLGKGRVSLLLTFDGPPTISNQED